MKLIPIVLVAALLTGCGATQDEQVRQENELADWGSRIELELRGAQDGDPCSYYASNVRAGLGLMLSADVTVECPEEE